jgi:hypothetical protein
MDNNHWITIAAAIVILAPLAAAVVYMVREQLRAQRYRKYKTLEQHAALNAADRATWMSGTLQNEETPTVSSFTGRSLQIVQFAALLVLIVIVLLWHDEALSRIDRQDKELSVLETQLHALAFSNPAAPASRAQTDPATPDAPPVTPVAASGTPMQQVCANLIGRVADAYEKAESSKVGQSLEELIKKVGCEKHLAP